MYKPLTEEQYKRARQKFSQEQILEMENKRKGEESALAPEAEKGTSFMDKMGERVKKIQSGVEEGASGYQKYLEDDDKSLGDVAKAGASLFRGGLRTVGQVAGAAGDVALEGIKAITPKSVEEGVAKGVESVANYAMGTRLGQASIRTAEENPTIARDLGDVFNIATLGGGQGVSPFAVSAVKTAERKFLQGLEEAKTTAQGLEKDWRVALSAEKIGEKGTQYLKESYEDATGATKKTKRLDEKSEAKGNDIPLFLAEKRKMFEVQDSKRRTQHIREELIAEAEPLNRALTNILKEQEKANPLLQRIPVDNLHQLVRQNVMNNKKIVNAGDTEKVLREVDAVFASWKNSFGDTVPFSKLNELKQAQWREVNWNNPDLMSARYSIAKTFQKGIEDSVDDINIKELNQYVGQHYDAVDFLRALEGTAVKGGRVTKIIAPVIGAIAGGASGGTFGSIGGAIASRWLVDLLTSSQVANPIKRAVIERTKGVDPAIKERALRYLDNQEKNPLESSKSTTATDTTTVNMNPNMDGSIPNEAPFVNAISDSTSKPHLGLEVSDITKKLNAKDKDLMIKYIDNVRLKESSRPELSKAEEGDISKLNELLGVNQNLSAEAIAKKYEEIIPNIKEQPRDEIGRFAQKKKITDYPLTTKFLEYAKGKTTLSRQEILEFAKRPELKKGEADLLNSKIKEFTGDKLPAQEFTDSIRRDLLELKPVKVKEPQYDRTTIDEGIISNASPEDYKKANLGKNYEEVVFESPITTNGSSHYPNSKNYFAHARGDEVVEGGKKIWREQEIQSDLLQKDDLKNQSNKLVNRMTGVEKREYDKLESFRQNAEGTLEQRDAAWKRQEELRGAADKRPASEMFSKLTPFTNDRFGERIMRERIKEKASKGYSKYRLPTGETIGKIEGFTPENKWHDISDYVDGDEALVAMRGGELASNDLKVGMRVSRVDDEFGSFSPDDSWIITDILGDGRFKAVARNIFNDEEWVKATSGKVSSKWLDDFRQHSETFDLTGKSNPQARRYSDWGKFLKNKYGGKEVTDLQGNTWVEIELKPEYKDAPIEAFGVVPFMTQDDDHEIKG